MHGWSLYSDTLEQISSDVPSKPTPLTTELYDYKVIFEWIAPTDNYQPITRFVVLLADTSETVFEPDLEHCDGNYIDIVTARRCEIPLLTLREKQLLVFDQVIKAKVAACNLNGCGSFSELNTVGARVQTEPVPPQMPTEGLLTNMVQVEVEWLEITAYETTRGSQITSYNLRWDAGTNGFEWFNLIGLDPYYTTTEYIVSDNI